jgi:hypothetical protein
MVPFLASPHQSFPLIFVAFFLVSPSNPNFVETQTEPTAEEKEEEEVVEEKATKTKKRAGRKRKRSSKAEKEQAEADENEEELTVWFPRLARTTVSFLLISLFSLRLYRRSNQNDRDEKFDDEMTQQKRLKLLQKWKMR